MAKKSDKVVDFFNSVFDVQRKFLDLFLDFVPEGAKKAKKHLRTAHKENLLALREILDSRIKNLEEKEKGAKKKGPQKVKVE